MSRVLTFSRVFPAYHPLAGQQTLFVEKILHSIANRAIASHMMSFLPDIIPDPFLNVKPKHHTIRAGNRWKAGDCFSPRVWGNDINPKSGRSGAYQSKQIIIAPDIQVKKVWPVTCELIVVPSENGKYALGHYGFKVNGNEVLIEVLAENDGLDYQELKDWFKMSEAMDKPKLRRLLFSGQIICWNDNINY